MRDAERSSGEEAADRAVLLPHAASGRLFLFLELI